MSERAARWADVLMQHRPTYRSARRGFLAEIVRLAMEAESKGTIGSEFQRPRMISLAALRMGIHRKAAVYTLSVATRCTLSGPQVEAVRQMAVAICVDVNFSYRAAAREFERLLAEAALRLAPTRKSLRGGQVIQIPNRTAAAATLHIHRNGIAHMLRAERRTA